MSRLSIFVISYSIIQAYAAAQSTLNLSSTSTPAGGAVTLNLSLSSTAGSEPSAIQWTMNYPPAALSNVSVVPGPAVSSVGKSLQCEPASGSYTCIGYGLETIIANGIVAEVTATPVASGTIAIGVNAVFAASQAGDSETITGFGGTITVTSSPAVSSVACNPQPLGPVSSAVCTVTLSSAAGVGGAVVTLTSNSASLTVPASVTVPAGAASASFTATSGAVSITQTAVVAAFFGSSVAAVGVSLTPATANNGNSLEIDGTRSEVTGSLANGTAVMPVSGPNSVVGRVALNGDGSVNFLHGNGGVGVYFQNCCGNSNNAYYKFNGSGLGAVFGGSQGLISFTLTSRYSFAQRQSSAAAPRYAFDARDGNAQHQFYFMTQIVGPSLVFYYVVGGVKMWYYVPQGTEDQVFGNGLRLNVAMQWSGGVANLYLNGSLVSSFNYTATTANWNDASNFDLGAYEDGTGGGYNCSDDAIANFKVSLP
jgi:hypothetical protein